MIIDMHCDTLYKIRQEKKSGRQLRLRDSRELCISLEKMKQCDYMLQNFAVYIDKKEQEDPYEDAMELVTLFEQEMAKNKDWILPVTSAPQIMENYKNGKLSAMLTLEEGGMCRGDLEILKEFFDHGARMMTLTWNYENELGYPAAMQRDDPGNLSAYGLKQKGFEFLEAMEEMGMIPDVSHLSDQGIFDVLDACKKPFVASHSNARAICNHQRNLTDEMLKQFGEHGCVAGLNYYPRFLGENLAEEEYLNQLVCHAMHMIQKSGIEAVGLGSDFDGFEGSSEPAHGADCDRLVWAFGKAGLTEDEIDHILYKNVLRLYQEVLVR